ncbi:MAG: hypothetical protein KFB96_01025 [Thiocapsa sp.]|uniref:hypothetical protein n=1 Tax=Thiocapsa sp. TaxID=2024551 RepID=UPI001BCEF10C|nr:hypothetical protein [Thiocapsa sp.]QVL49151.1 MAG: hypothetical protein KFB96_01025 [Thiocapsa sp.]
MNLQLEDILVSLHSMPTIMSVTQELEILQRLRGCDDQALISRLDLLQEILSVIEESHSGGGIFEVNDSNYAQFVAAADWLERLSKQHRPSQHRAMISGVATTLRTRFS